MNTQHTSGPWLAVDDHPTHACVHVYASPEDMSWRQEVAVCYAYGGQLTQALANAKLIAAAPEVLDALKALRAEVEEMSQRVGWVGRGARATADLDRQADVAL